MATRLPAADDVLGMVGLQRRGMSTWMESFAPFAIGVAAGAVLGMLFAPRAGSALRRELGQRAREMSADLRGRATDAMAERHPRPNGHPGTA